MLNQILTELHTAVADSALLKYADIDWGQIDDEESEAPTVDFPCGLFRIDEIEYTDRGRGVQDAIGKVSLRVADYDADAGQNVNAFEVLDLLDRLNKIINGVQSANYSDLTRVKLVQVVRKDGIREWVLTYRIAYVDRSMMKVYETLQGPVTIKVTDF